MVHSLLTAVEGGLDNMADETVPQIKIMAGQLLSNNGDAVQATPTSTNSAISEDEADQEPATVQETSSEGPNFHDDLLTAIERTIEGADEDEFVQPMATEIDAETNRDEPASPGIRDLVARIEGAMGEGFMEIPSTTKDTKIEAEDDLTRDLREIEALRGELHGLRQRILSNA